MNTINIWPILVASIVAFVIGALWYSPILFGKEWMSLIKMTDADIAEAKAKGMTKLYVIQFIMTVIMFCVLGFFVSAIGLQSASDGAFFAFIAWVGFIATGAVGGMLWEKTPFKLALIQSIGSLLSLVVGGAIIGGWK